MKGFKHTVFLLLIAGLFTTCQKNVVSLENYVEWIKNPANGLNKTKQVNDIKFNLQYKPAEYLVLLENKGDIDLDQIKKEISGFEGFHYFTFTIKKDDWNQELLKYNIQSQDEYMARVNYFAFEAQKDLMLVEGRDTSACTIFHFERNYGIAPDLRLLLGFKDKSPTVLNDFKLIFYDRVFQAGIIKINIDQNSLQSIPKID